MRAAHLALAFPRIRRTAGGIHTNRSSRGVRQRKHELADRAGRADHAGTDLADELVAGQRVPPMVAIFNA
jgi:hypothetical protein